MSGNRRFYSLLPIGRSLKLIGRFSGKGYKINFINSIPNIDVFLEGIKNQIHILGMVRYLKSECSDNNS